MLSGHANVSGHAAPPPWPPSAAAALLSGAPLFDGCRLRYLDMGTNLGRRIETLYDTRRTHQRSFVTIFANESRHDVCTVGFEPNPSHHHRLQALAEKLRKQGARVHVLQAAVAATNGEATFWSDRAFDKGEWGASLLHWFDGMLPRYSSTVPTVSLSWFLRRHVIDASPHGGAGAARLVAKMDIEAAEYEALPAAAEELCVAVDALELEQHYMLLSRMAATKQSLRPGGRPLDLFTARRMRSQLDLALRRLRERRGRGECKTNVRALSTAGT
uniref:Methyltransferase FkbM domain-containing protein n=1 Tax=Calcidiscus leptoporus TaxID=127549 RepID=A0A7S0JAU2_9EUKA|mmetsp:Transcript_483/g.1071  ORF Transcript_483/g.1071 Transcript_483/m.1071 type:complete len:273 (+) Transcript_483:54-872(+)